MSDCLRPARSGCKHVCSVLKCLIIKICSCIKYIWNILWLIFIEIPLLIYKMIRRSWRDNRENARIHSFMEFMAPGQAALSSTTRFRNFFYDNVTLGPETGLDHRIPVEHFAIPFLQEANREEIPFDPARVQHLTTLFERYVERGHPEISDWDTPATWDDLRSGIDKLITFVNKESSESYLRTIRNNLMIIVTQFDDNPDISDAQKASCLVELAKGGKRGCPTRMVEGSTTFANIFLGEENLEDLRSQIAKVLHTKRKEMLLRAAKGDVHILGELHLSIGEILHIHHPNPYNDNFLLMDNYAPQYALPSFLGSYTSDLVINTIERAINGVPIPGKHPHERAGRTISLDPIIEWLRENIPDDFQPDQEDREEAYIDTQIDSETNTLSRKGVIRLLEHFNFLQ